MEMKSYVFIVVVTRAPINMARVFGWLSIQNGG